MKPISTFDDAAVDMIGNKIQALRAHIRSLPHQGALIDIDTLLAVAEAEARRLTRDMSAQCTAGQPREATAKLTEAVAA